MASPILHKLRSSSPLRSGSPVLLRLVATAPIFTPNSAAAAGLTTNEISVSSPLNAAADGLFLRQRSCISGSIGSNDAQELRALAFRNRARSCTSEQLDTTAGTTGGGMMASQRQSTRQSVTRNDSSSSSHLRNSPIYPSCSSTYGRCNSGGFTAESLLMSPGRTEEYRMKRRLLYSEQANTPSSSNCALIEEHDKLSASGAGSVAAGIMASGLPSPMSLSMPPVVRKVSLQQRLESISCTPVETQPIATPLIGSGGFGSVFVGRYDGKLVAIKQLHNRRTKNNDKTKSASLRAEMNAFRLKHENIVGILSFTTHKHITQVVYEYAGARNLQSVIDDPAELLPFTRTHRFALQIAMALEHCHCHRIVHLDLKPSNVLLTQYDQCKLADFGSSRSLPLHKDFITHATTGTLVYKAPELLRSNRVSVACDVYSYGLVLWQLLARQALFEHLEHAHTIVFLVVSRDLRPDCELSAQCLTSEERQLIKVAVHCWHKLASQRPSASDVLHLLNCMAPKDHNLHF